MTKARDHRNRQAAFVLSAGALAGILIWSKLRLVTDIPRSAYAVPESVEDDVDTPAPAHPDIGIVPAPLGVPLQAGEIDAASEDPNDMQTRPIEP
ncbi:MAG: hypothetical protein AB8F26_10825 [Phycisphaerales bacterium]